MTHEKIQAQIKIGATVRYRDYCPNPQCVDSVSEICDEYIMFSNTCKQCLAHHMNRWHISIDTFINNIVHDTCYFVKARPDIYDSLWRDFNNEA